MARVNVLELRDTQEVGGPGKTILETFKAVDASRFTLHLGVFLTRHESDDSPFIRAARTAGMPVHVIRGFNQYDPRQIAQVARLVHALDIHIVHAHEVKSDVIALAAAALRRTALVTTMHGWIQNSLRQRCLVSLDRRIVGRFDLVLAVSRRIEEELLTAGVPRSRVQLLHNGIVVDRYRRSSQRRGPDSLVPAEAEGPILVSIGRLSPEKGHADLIDAIALLARSGQRVSALLVGDGPQRAVLEQKVRELGLADRVYFPGYLDRPERALQDADLVVVPSHTEGLPNVVLEALMMEVPVLATRVGGTPEIITDGVTGRLVEPHSPAALADGLRDFLRNPLAWNRMALAGRAVVERDFNFEGRTRRLEALYLEIANRVCG